MEFHYTVRVLVDRTEGLFASREEIAEQIREELEAAEPGALEGEEGGVYEVTEFEVEEVEAKRR